MKVSLIKLKYHCSKPFKLQKFPCCSIIAEVNSSNSDQGGTERGTFPLESALKRNLHGLGINFVLNTWALHGEELVTK